MKLLLEGAGANFGDKGTGWILGLLNLGGGDDQRFIDMQNDLNEILNDLSQIIGLLEDLAQQLALDTNRVETYIEGINAQAAITSIKTHYGPEGKDDKGDLNTLKWFSYMRSKDSTNATKGQIATLVHNINGAWDIEDHVNAIHDAIIPDIPSIKGLLDLWTNNFLLQGHVSDDQLMNYYKTLERYFGVLLFYQFKGANIVVEALNYQSSSGEQLNVSDQFQAGDETPASSYLTGTFQPQIKEQTDRFLQCVTKLIANNCGLYWESRFLPSTAQEIFARATFFVTQILGEDHYGLRVGLFGTSNLVHHTLHVGTMKGDDSVMVPGEMVDVDVPDRPYDYWGTLTMPAFKTLKKGTSYSLDKFDLGAFDPGTYGVYYVPVINWPYRYVGEAVVKTYTKDYIEDPDGEIEYGYLLGEFRLGGKEVMMHPTAFIHHYYHNNRDGSVNWLRDENLTDYLYLYLWGKNKDLYTKSHIDLKVEWWHKFTFDGSESTKAYLHIAGEITGNVEIACHSITTEAEIGYHVGVWDTTNNKLVKRIKGLFKTSYDGCKKLYYDKHLNDTISFTLEPGVSYYVYANIFGNGERDFTGYDTKMPYEYKCIMKLKHLSLTFVDSEF
jgi:hypothetical protein